MRTQHVYSDWVDWTGLDWIEEDFIILHYVHCQNCYTQQQQQQKKIK